MKNFKAIQLKAALLLWVFSANTMLGLACSLGFQMGYNEHHHQVEMAAPSSHTAHHGSDTNHHEEKNHHSGSESGNDDCCSNEVTSFNLVNKMIPHQAALVHPVIFVALNTTWYNSEIPPYNNVTKDIKPFVRSHHPPIPDIRVAIQSFQI